MLDANEKIGGTAPLSMQVYTNQLRRFNLCQSMSVNSLSWLNKQSKRKDGGMRDERVHVWLASEVRDVLLIPPPLELIPLLLEGPQCLGAKNVEAKSWLWSQRSHIGWFYTKSCSLILLSALLVPSHKWEFKYSSYFTTTMLAEWL